MIHSFRNSSFRDELTGLYTEEYFMETIYREWYRLMRENEYLTLMTAHFCPSLASDTNLEKYQRLAEILRSSLYRASDLISRFNNNEFTIGLFNLDDNGTLAISHRINEQLSSHPELSRLVTFGAINLKPTNETLIEKVILETQKLAGEALKDKNQNLMMKVIH